MVSKHVPPRKNARNKRKSEIQQFRLRQFAEASAYAKEITREWEPRCYYKQKAKEYGVTSAYTAAVTAFMRGDAAVMEEAAEVRAKALEVVEMGLMGNSVSEDKTDVALVCVDNVGENVEGGGAGEHRPECARDIARVEDLCEVRNPLGRGTAVIPSNSEQHGGHHRVLGARQVADLPVRVRPSRNVKYGYREPVRRWGNMAGRWNREWGRGVDGGIGNYYLGNMLIRSSLEIAKPGMLLRGG